MADPGTMAILAVQFGSVDHQIRARSQAIVQAPAVQCQTVQQQMPQLAPVSGAFQTGHSSEPELLHPVPSEANPTRPQQPSRSVWHKGYAPVASLKLSIHGAHSLVKNLVDSGNGTALSFIVVAPILWAASGPVPAAINAWCGTVAARSPLLVPGLGAIQYVATTASSVVRLPSYEFLVYCSWVPPCGLVCGRGNPGGSILRRVMRVGNPGWVNTTPSWKVMRVGRPILPQGVDVWMFNQPYP